MIAIAVLAIIAAVWLTFRSLSEPSGTRPLDGGSASVPPPSSPAYKPRPATEPADPMAGSRRSAPAK